MCDAAAFTPTDDVRVDNPTAAAAGWPAEVSVRPLRLHTQEVEGALGGHCFSADFARYLAKVKPRLVTGWQLRVGYWWASAYGRERVKRAFLRDLGPERGAVAYLAARDLTSQFRPYDAVMAQTGYSAYKLGKFVSLARHYASRPSR